MNESMKNALQKTANRNKEKEKLYMETVNSIILNHSTKVYFSPDGLQIGVLDPEGEKSYTRFTLKQLISKIEDSYNHG